jgi:hypothetical protein
MTKVLFRIFKSAPNANTPASGTLKFRPTLKRVTEDKSVILPTGFTVEVTNGRADVELAPTEPGWAWEIVGVGFDVPTWIERVLVPDVEEAFYTDLPKVEVSTLDPELEPEAAWWAEIEKLKPVQGEPGLKGDKGDSIKGDPGTAAVISGATATTLPADSSATVTLGGTAQDRTFSFGIPQGLKGEPGASVKGDPGPAGKIVAATATTVAPDAPAKVLLGGTSEERSFTFEIPQGLKGDPGTSIKGDPGTAAVISGATASTLPADSSATVTLGGTPQDRTFSFGIPQGLKGEPGASVKGDPGTAAVISSATVATLAPGSSATVTLGGTAQDRTFAFGIPRGADGAPGGSGLSGAGVPNGVITADVGTLYTDTSMLKGAVTWVKTTAGGNTGWQVLYGDTGIVRIIGSLKTGWRTNGSGNYYWIQRIGANVRISLPQLTQQTGATSGLVMTLPAGYLQQGDLNMIPLITIRSMDPSTFVQMNEFYLDPQGNLYMKSFSTVATSTMRGNLYLEFAGATYNTWP